MKTYYAPDKDAMHYDPKDTYVAVEAREGIKTPFILYSSNRVNDIANVLEEYKQRALSTGHFNNRYYFTPSNSLTEVIPLPKSYAHFEKGRLL